MRRPLASSANEAGSGTVVPPLPPVPVPAAPNVRLSSENSSLLPVSDPVKNVMDVMALSDRKPKKPENVPPVGLLIAKTSWVVASANVNEKPSPAPRPPGLRSQSSPG
jgi:hypothetical protein